MYTLLVRLIEEFPAAELQFLVNVVNLFLIVQMAFSMFLNLQVALVKLALKNEGLIVPGYTHLQRAQPVLLQHLLLAYVEQVT